MVSKNISITKDVYEKLVRVKKENESFSELFIRLLSIQRTALENIFGTWNLTDEEMTDIWGDIVTQPSRKWTKQLLEGDKI